MMETDLKNYIEEHIPELSGHIYPVTSPEPERASLVYTFTHTSGGHVKEAQLELRIISPDYDECKELEQKLLAILDFEEDAGFKRQGGTYFRAGVAGGGTLHNFEARVFENTLIFIIDWRSANAR